MSEIIIRIDDNVALGELSEFAEVLNKAIVASKHGWMVQEVYVEGYSFRR